MITTELGNTIKAIIDDGYSVEIRKIKGGYMVVCRKYSEEDHESFSARGNTIFDAIYNAAEKWSYGYE